MSLDEFLGEMQKLITASQQGDLFGDRQSVADKSAEVCVEFLRGQGFSVRKPVPYPTKITKLDDLLTMFYAIVRDTYTSNITPYYNMKKDRAIAKQFVENRIEQDGIDRSNALQQCGLIIKTMFDHPEIFKFETPPTFGIFGQAEMGWVTDRAVQLINKEIAKDVASATERAVNKMSKEISEKYPTMGYSLEELLSFRDKLEDQYGKKES